MKVILLSDVKNVGKKYDVTDVKPGFARNFLFAQGFAEAITKSSAKRVALLEKKRDEEKKRQSELLDKAFDGVKGATITLRRKANDEGHLYAGVTVDDIALELSKAIGVSIPSEHIRIEKSIKTLGELTIPFELNDRKAVFTLKIEGEDEDEKK